MDGYMHMHTFDVTVKHLAAPPHHLLKGCLIEFSTQPLCLPPYYYSSMLYNNTNDSNNNNSNKKYVIMLLCTPHHGTLSLVCVFLFHFFVKTHFPFFFYQLSSGVQNDKIQLRYW